MTKYNVVIVDDHEICLNTMQQIAAAHPSLNVEHIFTNAHQAMERIKQKPPVDFLITDLSMDEMNGMLLIKEAKKQNINTKILVFSMHEEGGIIKNAAKMGIDGYVLKSAPLAEIEQAIDTIISGAKFFSAKISHILVYDEPNKQRDLMPKLTRREKQILQLISSELTTLEIARELHLSESTIETYRQSLLFKFDCKNSVGMVAKAYQFGLL